MSDQQQEPPRRPPSSTGGWRRPVPPGEVTAAMVLWLCAGALTLVSMFALQESAPDPAYASQNSGAESAEFLAAVITLCVANRLRWGSRATRGWLSVLGLPLLAGFVTIPFVVAAVVLQYLPKSNEWFRLVNPPTIPPR